MSLDHSWTSSDGPDLEICQMNSNSAIFPASNLNGLANLEPSSFRHVNEAKLSYIYDLAAPNEK